MSYIFLYLHIFPFSPIFILHLSSKNYNSYVSGDGGGRSTEKKRNWKNKQKKGKLQFFSNKIQTRVLINREKLCLLAVWKEL